MVVYWEYAKMHTRKEFYEPEELDTLSRSFDDACKALDLTKPENEEPRRELADIVLRLTELAQLGPGQIKATATRLYRDRNRNTAALEAYPHDDAGRLSPVATHRRTQPVSSPLGAMLDRTTDSVRSGAHSSMKR